MQLLNRSRNLMLGASILALGLGATVPVWAQTAPAPAPTDQTQAKSDNQVVVVTARRKAIQNATERKKNSDTIIDSVVADEAGKLPDTSITEVLQRVAGVTMVRFASLSSPDQFTFEGSGVQIRGLSGVTGLLNGREVFSANGGSGLNWGQVTPELMAAVDVYKASDSDLIEGGLGGAIDLRTRMPFDYKKPEIDATLTDSYGDLSKKSSPSESVLLTDRWDTPIGNMGLLVDLAQADFKDADSFVRTEPYYKEVNAGVTTYVPGGFDYGNDTYDRKRTGLYEAFQWRPFDGLTIWQTAFSSTYKLTNGGGGVFVVMGANAVATNATYNNGVFQSGQLNANGYTPTNQTTFGPGSNNNYEPSTDTTADFSQGFNWNISDKLNVKGALQYVDSWYFGQDYGMGIGTGVNLGSINMNVTGSLPNDTIANSAQLMTTASTAAPNSIIWNQQRHHAHMTAVNLDSQYDIGDGFFKELLVGGRYADRAESDSFVGTWWSAINESWDGTQKTVATSPAADWAVYTFPNFFGGKIASPGNYYLSSFKTVDCPTCLTHDLTTYALGTEFAQPYSSINASNITPGNNTLTTTRVQTADLYGEVKFGSDHSWFNSPFTGNFGVRFVYNKVQSDGEFSVSSTGPFYLNTTDAATSETEVGGSAAAASAWLTAHPGQQLPLTYQLTSAQAPSNVPLRGDFAYTRALPSLNINFKPNPGFIWRLAINQTMSPPSYSDDAVGGSVGLQSLSTNPGNVGNTGSYSLPGIFNGYSGNLKTELKPQISTNEDLSLEWYPSTSTNYHFDLFNKDIKDLIVYNYESVGVSETYYNGTTPQTVAANEQVLQDFNATKTSTITGLEIGARTFFDNLPGAWSGLGVEANYTRISSDSPDQYAYDMNGNPLHHIPIPALSNDSFNLALLYDKGDWDARLAYHWQSAYMAGVGNGTNGSYTPNGSTTAINYNLPVYADSFGQLDGSVSYKINENWKVSAEASNLLDGIPKTKMEILQGVFETRSWFLEDRRYSISLHMSY